MKCILSGTSIKIFIFFIIDPSTVHICPMSCLAVPHLMSSLPLLSPYCILFRNKNNRQLTVALDTRCKVSTLISGTLEIVSKIFFVYTFELIGNSILCFHCLTLDPLNFSLLFVRDYLVASPRISFLQQIQWDSAFLIQLFYDFRICTKYLFTMGERLAVVFTFWRPSSSSICCFLRLDS